VTAAVFLAGVGYAVSEHPGRVAGTVVTWARPVPPSPGPLVALGDSWTDLGWSGAPGWAEYVADDLGLPLVNLARGGVGYLRSSGAVPTIPAQAAQVPADAAVVIVFGSPNDLEHAPADVTAAASATLATLARLAPAAGLVVVGPGWPDEPPSPAARRTRDAVAAAAASAGVAWVDPMPWLAGSPQLVADDGWHPSQPAGHRLVADRLRPYVATALPPVTLTADAHRE
jgi:hypothetical protein